VAVAERRFVMIPPAPFRLDLTVWALRRRAHNLIDRWDGAIYRRALPLADEVFALAVRQDGDLEAPRLEVTLTGGAVNRRIESLARAMLSRMLGLDIDLSGFAAMAARDRFIGKLSARMRGLRPPRFPTVFEGLVNGIACQQLSLDVGIHLLNRLATAHGRPTGPDTGGLRAFPHPFALAATDPAALKSLGFSRAKAEAVINAAREMYDGALDLEGLAGIGDSAACELLKRLRGVGRWTAEYVMLRGLGRLHVFPGDDVGARNKLKSFLGFRDKLDYQKVGQLASAWRPYAGVVYFHLLVDSLSSAGFVVLSPGNYH
jgi:DNA-3-methyladenine glycosylase II